ncbi:hypothetical protein ACOBR2_09515 [Telmatobacter bradus]|uniref:hypothetical protein n=1 Tax=Telmatobacter bradus TaxID=474953 RepID=UPI003B42F149
MNKPRQWNRRDFTPTSAGYFTVLRESGWFSTLPLPGGYRYQTGTKKKPALKPESAAMFGITAVQSPVLQWYKDPKLGLRRLVRPALILLAVGLIYLSIYAFAYLWAKMFKELL